MRILFDYLTNWFVVVFWVVSFFLGVSIDASSLCVGILGAMDLLEVIDDTVFVTLFAISFPNFASADLFFFLFLFVSLFVFWERGCSECLAINFWNIQGFQNWFYLIFAQGFSSRFLAFFRVQISAYIIFWWYLIINTILFSTAFQTPLHKMVYQSQGKTYFKVFKVLDKVS